MSTSSDSIEAARTDYGLPGNDLDPHNPTVEQRKTIPLIIRVYGALCALDGIISLPLMGAYFGVMVYRLALGQEGVLIGTNLTLTVTMTVIGSILAFVASVALILFGWTLIKSYRRDAGRWAYALIVMTVGQILIGIILQGIPPPSIPPCAKSATCSAAYATLRTARQQKKACWDETSPARATSNSTSSTSFGSLWSAAC